MNEQEQKPSFLNESSLALVRHALTTAGGVLVTKGYTDDATLEKGIGALVLVLGFFWSLYRKWKRSRPETPGAGPKVALSMLLGLGMLVFTPGCANLGSIFAGKNGNSAWTSSMAKVAQGAIQVGATYDLTAKPEHRAAFEGAQWMLGNMLTNGTYDLTQFTSIMQGLPIKEFQGEDGAFITAALPGIWDAFSGIFSQVSSDESTRAMMQAAYNGISAALAATASGEASPLKLTKAGAVVVKVEPTPEPPKRVIKIARKVKI